MGILQVPFDRNPTKMSVLAGVMFVKRVLIIQPQVDIGPELPSARDIVLFQVNLDACDFPGNVQWNPCNVKEVEFHVDYCNYIFRLLHMSPSCGELSLPLLSHLFCCTKCMNFILLPWACVVMDLFRSSIGWRFPSFSQRSFYYSTDFMVMRVRFAIEFTVNLLFVNYCLKAWLMIH